MEYAILTLPSANRVYAHDAPRLAQAELATVAPALHCGPRALISRAIGGVPYLCFTSTELDDHDRFVISNLSATYALFEVQDATLLPLPLQPLAFFDSDLITIQRYSGKTNEQFTHLMVNLAVAVSAAAHERAQQGLPVRLLDPVAGRGTTLNRGLMYGFDVGGVDIDSSDVDAYRGFLTQYLKNVGRPFKLQEATIRKGALAGSRHFDIRIDRQQRVDVVNGDTVNVADHFGERSFDVLVADLPYGVRHGSTTDAKLARRPGDLVLAAAAGWRRALRSGAGVALSWNTKTLPRQELEDAMRDAGFEVIDLPMSFEHRVDRAITRDVVVATTT